MVAQWPPDFEKLFTMDTAPAHSLAEANHRQASGSSQLKAPRSCIVSRSQIRHGCHHHRDGSLTEWFASLYLPFDRCSVPVVGACVDRGGWFGQPGMATQNLESG